MSSQTEYLDRAKELRVMAKQVSDVRTREYLIGAADAYEHEARQELEPGPFGRFLTLNRNRAH